jgi:hypothetical protein
MRSAQGSLANRRELRRRQGAKIIYKPGEIRAEIWDGSHHHPLNGVDPIEGGGNVPSGKRERATHPSCDGPR